MRTISILIMMLLIASCATQKPIKEISTLQKIEISETTYPENLNVTTRSEWGWTPIAEAAKTHEINKITIHHGGELFAEDKDVMQYLINFQSWSISTKNWIDNPYHYMIDLKGNIYEARPIQYPGDTNTSYDVTGHALICVLGNYEIQTISDAQLDALAKLTAFLADTYDVDQSDIKTHKDYTETLCPGKDLYRYFEDESFLAKVENLRQ
jgi:hypothetical protein